MKFRRTYSPFFYLILIFTLSACTYIEEYVPGQATATLAAPTEMLISTDAPLPSDTPTPTLAFTPTAAAPTATPTTAFTPTPTIPPKPYALQSGAVIVLPAFTQAGAGCAWMGVGGQVIGKDSQPVKNLVVAVNGMQNGAPAEWMGYTGTANAYGPGGFEIQLASQVAAAQYTIQVFDLDGEPLSDPFRFTTSADCQQNLTLVNFSPNLNLQPVMYLPSINR